MAIFGQSEFDIRCEWGRRGLEELASVCGVVVVVDVLSFSTAVDIATARGATVFPYPLRDDSAAAYSDSVGGRLASSKRGGGFSLSPQSLLGISRGYRLVLPSPNGAALCFSAHCRNLLTACLRNAPAVSEAARRLVTTNSGSAIAVIPAGETWDDGSLRPSLEDLIGAGSVIAGLPGRRSPEAELALAAFERFARDLPATLRACASGKELLERGFAADVDLAAQHNVSRNVPVLEDGAFVSMKQL